jgi:hypothetical protein
MVPSALLQVPVPIGHLIPPRLDLVVACTRVDERRPYEGSKDLVRWVGGRWRCTGERGSDLSSLAHRSAVCSCWASIAIEYLCSASTEESRTPSAIGPCRCAIGVASEVATIDL